jgi:hypothetical protein
MMQSTIEKMLRQRLSQELYPFCDVALQPQPSPDERLYTEELDKNNSDETQEIAVLTWD